MIESLEARHWEGVKRVYLEGIATGQATFETKAPAWEEWDAKHLPFARLAALDQSEGRLAGWAAISSVSTRRAYAGVAEVSVYVTEAVRGKGIGRALLQRLIEESERNGIWTLQASIFPQNIASMKLHHGCGFRTVGVRERIASLHGTWCDTLILERRSKFTGID